MSSYGFSQRQALPEPLGILQQICSQSGECHQLRGFSGWGSGHIVRYCSVELGKDRRCRVVVQAAKENPALFLFLFLFFRISDLYFFLSNGIEKRMCVFARRPRSTVDAGPGDDDCRSASQRGFL